MNLGFLKKISWKKNKVLEKKEISRTSIVRDWILLLSFFFVLFLILTAGYYTLFIVYREPHIKNTAPNNSLLDDAKNKYKSAFLHIEMWQNEYQKIETTITTKGFSL
jgi:hypothetical protein